MVNKIRERKLVDLPHRLMRENINIAPACHVQFGANWQEIHGFLRQCGTVFALQYFVEPQFQPVQVQNVRGGVSELILRQYPRAPVGGLLLFRQIDADQLARQILEAVAVGKGAREDGGHFGAIDRLRHHAEMAPDRGEIGAGEMKQLHDLGIGHEFFQTGRGGVAEGQLHQMRIPVARRKLHEAKPVPIPVKPHRLGIDRDAIAEGQVGGQVAFMERDGHGNRPMSVAQGRNGGRHGGGNQARGANGGLKSRACLR
jgi:hypothetical protein